MVVVGGGGGRHETWVRAVLVLVVMKRVKKAAGR